MKLKNTFYILIFLLVYIVSCNHSQKSVEKDKKLLESSNIKDISFQKYGNDTTFSFSPEKSYILCQKSIDQNNLNPNIIKEFFVYDLNTNNIIYEDKLSSASVKWYSDFELLIILQKGFITSQNDNGRITYIYNLKDKTKTELKNNPIPK